MPIKTVRAVLVVVAVCAVGHAAQARPPAAGPHTEVEFRQKFDFNRTDAPEAIYRDFARIAHRACTKGVRNTRRLQRDINKRCEDGLLRKAVIQAQIPELAALYNDDHPEAGSLVVVERAEPKRAVMSAVARK